MRGYEPQPVTPRSLYRWLNQFDPEFRGAAVSLLLHVTYFDKIEVTRSLVHKNSVLMDELEIAGIPPDHIIYVHISEPGSSSSLMLNLLRNAANLERLDCKFVDASNQEALLHYSIDLEDVAIVYVDDFLGSGEQFCDVRDFVAAIYPKGMPEFLLAPAICEEAFGELSKRDIRIFAEHIHSKSGRPLHPNSSIFDEETKNRLREISLSLDRTYGLGFKNMASMVVMYHNAPDNTPLILRGSLNQVPFKGILPRTTDLPVPNTFWKKAANK